MATQFCPKCKTESFTWHMSEEDLTIWLCSNCSYEAIENETFERNCSQCGTKTESRLEDPKEKYWWCCKCNRISIID